MKIFNYNNILWAKAENGNCWFNAKAFKNDKHPSAWKDNISDYIFSCELQEWINLNKLATVSSVYIQIHLGDAETCLQVSFTETVQ